MGNLILLCSHHHHLVHEGGFTIERAASGRITARSPHGWTIPSAPFLVPATPDELAGAQGDLRIDAGTLATRWSGEQLDLKHVVWTLLQRTEPLEAA